MDKVIYIGEAAIIDAREGITGRELSDTISDNTLRTLSESGFGHTCGYEYTTCEMAARDLCGKWLCVLPRQYSRSGK